MKKLIAAIVAITCAGMSYAQQPSNQRKNPGEGRPKTERKAEAPRTLDRQKPDPRPGEGFLIRGREGTVMDKGRPDTTANWDLWRK